LQVRKELRLLGIGSLVKDGRRGSDVLLRFGLIPASGSLQFVAFFSLVPAS
jgi:hypothetical protein